MAKGLDTELLEFLPEDSNVQRFNMSGNPLIGLPDDSPSVLAMKDILEKLRVI
jgi:CO dehydrogenase nickel-insertion accessory protein CooC1